jgi:hypothetical protein
VAEQQLPPSSDPFGFTSLIPPQVIETITNFDKLSYSLERTNSLFSAFAKYRQGSFTKMGGEVLNFIKPLDRLNRTFSSVNSGISALGVNVSKQLGSSSVVADTLATKIDKVRQATLMLPTRSLIELNRAIRDEQTLIGQAAAVQVAGYAFSNTEGRSIVAKSRFDVVQSSASLPGDTRIHQDVLDTTIGQAMRMARIANETMESAQQFAVKSSGQIASIAAISGADRHQTVRFAQEIFSGSLSMNSPLALVQTNPMLQQAIALTLRKYGAQQFGDVPITAQKNAISEILSYAASDETLGQATQSVEGAMQTFETNLKNMYDVTRVTGKRQGVDVSVYNEIKPLITKYYSAVNNLLQYLNDSKYSPLKLLTEASTKLYGNFGGTGQTKGAFAEKDYSYAKANFGFFDYLQWFDENLTRLKPEFNKSPSLLLNVIVSGISKFGSGFTNVMSYFNELLQKRFNYGIGSVDIGTLLGTMIADIINSIIRGLNPLGDTIRVIIANFFNSLMGRIDKVAAFQFLNNVTATKQFYEQLILKFVDFKRPNNDTTQVSKSLLNLGLAGGGVYGLFSAFRKGILGVNDGFDKLIGILARGKAGLLSLVTLLPLGLGTFLGTKVAGIGGLATTNKIRQGYDFVTQGAIRSQSRHDEAMASRFLAPFADPAEFFFGQRSGNDKIGELSKAGRNKRILGAAERVGGVSNILEGAAGILPMLASTGVLPQWLANAAVGGYLTTGVVSQGLKVGASSRRISDFAENIGTNSLVKGKGLISSFHSSISQIPVVGSVLGLFTGGILKLQGFLGKLFSVEGLGVLFQAGPRILGWFAIMTSFFSALYNNSADLRKAVNRWMTFFRSIFETLGLVFGQIWDRFLRPVFKLLGDLLAKVLNFIADLIPFMPAYNNVEESDKNLLNERTKEQNRQESLGRQNNSIGLPIYGDQQQTALGFGAGGYMPNYGFLGDQVGYAAAGSTNIPLVNAASMEIKAAPINTSLIVANSSETIRTAQQEQLLQRSLLSGNGTNFNIPQIIFHISSQNGNPDEIADRVSELFLTRLNQLRAAPI